VRHTPPDLAARLDPHVANVYAHTPAGTAFTVSLRGSPSGGAILTVSDEGPGLPTAAVAARGASGGGSTGLGLDIAARTAERSGGDVHIGQSAAGGAAIAVTLGPPAQSIVRSHRR
jgi:signal transduction histidine kinase